MVPVSAGFCGDAGNVASLLWFACGVDGDPRLRVPGYGAGTLGRHAGGDHVYRFCSADDCGIPLTVAVAVLVSFSADFAGVGVSYISLDFPGMAVGDSEDAASSASCSSRLDFWLRHMCVQHLHAAVVAGRVDFRSQHVVMFASAEIAVAPPRSTISTSVTITSPSANPPKTKRRPAKWLRSSCLPWTTASPFRSPSAAFSPRWPPVPSHLAPVKFQGVVHLDGSMEAVCDGANRIPKKKRGEFDGKVKRADRSRAAATAPGDTRGSHGDAIDIRMDNNQVFRYFIYS